MKNITITQTGLNVSAVGLGCMRLTELDEAALPRYIEKSAELGINFFDHADIYGGGECERRFGNALGHTSLKREDIIIQSKCGIVPGKMYDLSSEYILSAVDGILGRLKTDYLDILLLHRPDALIDPEDTAKAFDTLYKAGKVLHFGVSNFRPMQIELLKKYASVPIAVDQLQLSIPHSVMISEGIEANMTSDGAVDRTGDVLDYCRLNGITVQAWSPFGGKNGSFIDDNEGYPDLNWVLGETAAKYGVSKTTIAAAWILRHPAHIQLLAGTMDQNRLEDIVKATDLTLSKEEWYKLYLAAGHILP